MRRKGGDQKKVGPRPAAHVASAITGCAGEHLERNADVPRRAAGAKAAARLRPPEQLHLLLRSQRLHHIMVRSLKIGLSHGNDWT